MYRAVRRLPCREGLDNPFSLGRSFGVYKKPIAADSAKSCRIVRPTATIVRFGLAFGHTDVHSFVHHENAVRDDGGARSVAGRMQSSGAGNGAEDGLG